MGILYHLLGLGNDLLLENTSSKIHKNMAKNLYQTFIRPFALERLHLKLHKFLSSCPEQDKWFWLGQLFRLVIIIKS